MALLPDVIFLNGTSSAGKTSIARQLQADLEVVYLGFSIDTILYTLPPCDIDAMIQGSSITRTGYRYSNLVRGFHAAAVGLLSAGNRLIMDDAMTNVEHRDNFKAALTAFRIVQVGVLCDIEIARQRERNRGDRAPGTVDREYPLVHMGMHYDITVDTGHLSPEAAAAAIMQWLHTANATR